MIAPVPVTGDTIHASKQAAALVPLLALVIFINYVDRGSLNTTAPLIKDQLHFSATEIGLLTSAFFWTYVPAQILTGWMTERYSTARILAGGLALWAIATSCLGLAGGFMSFLWFRVLLGLGESVTFPCSSKLLAQYLPPDRLGRANGLIAVGMALGPGFGMLAGGMMMAQYGWRAVFLLFGLCSLLWLLPWHRSTRHIAAPDRSSSRKVTPSLIQLLRCRDLWGATLGHFCANYAFYFIIAWLPLYLVKERGMSLQTMALLGGVIYTVYAISAYASGLITDRLIRRGATINRVRKGFISGALAGIAVCLTMVGLDEVHVLMAGLLLVGIPMGMGTPNIYAIGQTLAGPQAAGKWVGIQNSLANLAGIIGPVISGYLIDRTGHFQLAFLVAALFSLTGVIGFAAVVRKVETLDWDVELAPAVFV